MSFSFGTGALDRQAKWRFETYAQLDSAFPPTSTVPSVGDRALLTQSGAIFVWEQNKFDMSTGVTRTGWFNVNHPILTFDFSVNPPEVIPGVIYTDPGAFSQFAFARRDQFRALIHVPAGQIFAVNASVQDASGRAVFASEEGGKFIGSHNITSWPWTPPFPIDVGDYGINTATNEFFSFNAPGDQNNPLQSFSYTGTPFAQGEPVNISTKAPTDFVQPGTRVAINVPTLGAAHRPGSIYREGYQG